MARVSGTSFVVGRSGEPGPIDDVRIYTSPTGLNYIEIARDSKNLSSYRYIVERRVTGGHWRRLLFATSFEREATPDRLTEVRADVRFEEIPNFWGIEPERCWGLPEGMESPWSEPLEMVANELLLPEGVEFVSGDAPVNIPISDTYRNGKYMVAITGSHIEVSAGDAFLADLTTDTSGLSWTEGVAGAAYFRDGSVYIEPAKPPLFSGRFILDREPVYLLPGLYEYGEAYLVSNVPIRGNVVSGNFALVSDPLPERWVRRVFCRAYVDLVFPSNIPPLIEEEPKRISIRVERVPTDFTDLKPEVVTPYANKTGVFNAWEVEGGVENLSLERPYDMLLPMHRLEDWGGNSVWTAGDFYPAPDFRGEGSASYPNPFGFELPDLPPVEEGALFFRWKDSSYANIVSNDWLDVIIRGGWLYFENRVSPGATGIYPLDPETGWKNVKLEWTSSSLTVNDSPAFTEELTWYETLVGREELPSERWGDVLNIPEQMREDAPTDFPIAEERYEEIPPEWDTGLPEGEVEPPIPDYSYTPRTWGRVLYEEFDSTQRRVILAGDMTVKIADIQDDLLGWYL